jgi:hypothetical protein
MMLSIHTHGLTCASPVVLACPDLDLRLQARVCGSRPAGKTTTIRLLPRPAAARWRWQHQLYEAPSTATHRQALAQVGAL